MTIDLMSMAHRFGYTDRLMGRWPDPPFASDRLKTAYQEGYDLATDDMLTCKQSVREGVPC